MRRLPAELPSLTSHGGHAGKVVRFGVFELDLRTGELRKQGVKLKLQGQPLQILQALVESPGQLVTREELRRRLWPSDVFVDFDSGLNTAANRLRIALGDSAENPRYIETLARAGYRFIAPIEVVDSSSPPTDAPRPRRRRVVLAVTAAALLVVVLAAWLLFERPPSDGLQFRQVTFRRGQIWGARFAPDGHAILYTANWDNGPRHLFLTNPSSPESRSLGFDDLRLVSVSRSGELAMLSIDGTVPIAGGTLHRVPLNGGAPKHVEHHVMSADWSPDGTLAIAHAIDGVNQLEFPVGTVLQKTAGWISSIRISPDRDRVAFIEHPLRNENQGSVKLAEAGRPLRTLSADWANAGGIAWHPSGQEIWFTASRDGAPKSLWAVTLSGKLRSVAQIAGTMTLCDIASDGRALTSRETRLLEMAAIVEGEATQRDLSWLDRSRVADVSADGRLVLFDEGGVAAGSQFLTYVHRLDDQSTVRLGEGRAMALTSDGRFALTLDSRERTRLRLLPLGDGKAADLPPIEGGAGRILPTPAPLAPLLWARDDRLYVQQLGAYTQIPTRIARFDLSTGHLEPWRDVTPVDSLGVNAITKVMLSEDTRTVVFNYRRVLSELFVAEPAAR